MSDSTGPGTIGWVDLTVPEGERVRDFYAAVVGWEHDPVEMGGYQDYQMLRPGTREVVAGICHARGANAGLPPRWLVYVNVSDLEASLRRCRELGGAILQEPRDLGSGRLCVIRDPAGAEVALWEPAASPPSDLG